jgi:arginine deiminase
MYAPLESVLLRHPSDAFQSQNFLDQNWKRFGFLAVPDFRQACMDYDTFVDVLNSSGVHVEFLRGIESTSIDSIYTHDPAETVENGMILCRMGKELRRVESDRIEQFCIEAHIPIHGRIQAPGIIEGGDIIWLDDHTLAIGEGYRSNEEGIRQFAEFSRPVVTEVISVPLPHWRGSSDVLHLMSLISPIAPKKAVVYRALLPVPFLRELARRDVELIDVPDEEYDSMGCNVLALTPDVCVMAEGNPITQKRIESVGIEVRCYPPAEISTKGQGGPTCLSRPLVRNSG